MERIGWLHKEAMREMEFGEGNVNLTEYIHRDNRQLANGVLYEKERVVQCMAVSVIRLVTLNLILLSPICIPLRRPDLLIIRIYYFIIVPDSSAFAQTTPIQKTLHHDRPALLNSRSPSNSALVIAFPVSFVVRFSVDRHTSSVFPPNR